jgi:hypothetical protein
MNILVDAAIKYSDGEVLVASRHWQIITLRSNSTGERTLGDAVQGFVDNSGEFYTREEAKELAVKNGQISSDHDGDLYSEDLWPQRDAGF